MNDVADIEAVVRAVSSDRKPDLRLWLRLLSCSNLVSATVRRRLRTSFGLTLPQFDLMAQLYREPAGLRLSDLSRRMMVSNGNVTGLVERLVGDGFVTRDPALLDRRSAVVRLTAHGKIEFAKVAKAHEKWIRELFGAMDEATRERLTVDLSLLKASVNRSRDDIA